MNLPQTFLHTNVDPNNDTTFMVLRGELAELVEPDNPKLYRKYITVNKNRKILYMRLQRAVYETLQAALLFYQKLVNQLAGVDFKLDPYNPCVCKKVVGKKQMTDCLARRQFENIAR